MLLDSTTLIFCSLLALTACADRACPVQGVSAQIGSVRGIDDTCSADGICPGADKYKLSQEDTHPPQEEVPERAVLDLLLDHLQLQSKDGDAGLIFEMARDFSKDLRHTQFAHMTEIDRRLLFVKRVKLLMDTRELEKKGGHIETGTQQEGNQPEGPWHYPALGRLEPGKVGDVAEVELVEGRTHRRITRAVHPPVFEIPDFLTAEECDTIVRTAEEVGFLTSRTFGQDNLKEMMEMDRADITRLSDQAWLFSNQLDQGGFIQSLQSRLTKLTGVPLDVIERSEAMQVVTYSSGGHYHAHLDSSDLSELTCCHQKNCGEAFLKPSATKCCRMCRYITVLYYLNDVELGGETAFPLADMPDTLAKEMVKSYEWSNLSRFCHNSSLVVKPRKGTAIMWYNQFLDEQGYLGKIDLQSYHGGCDILKGTKWIANNWLSSSTFQDRFVPSIFKQ